MNRAPRTTSRATASIAGALLASVLLALAASPALAGGWWTYPQLDTEPMSPGETVTASATVMFGSSAEAAAAGDQYYAYLVRGIDQQALKEAMSRGEPGGWWSTPDETVLLGRLEFGATDTNMRRVTATFIVPEVETGAYSLMFCTLGCADSLGDVVPLEGVYVGEPAAVRLIRDSRETNRQVLGMYTDLETRLQSIHRSVGSVGGRVDDLDTRAGEIVRSVDGVELSMSMLRDRVDELEAGSDLSPGWLSWAGWFVAGLALAVAWSHRRSATPKNVSDPDDFDGLGIEADDEDAPAPEFVTAF